MSPLLADTIDLQDHHSPSAQDHSRQHANAGNLGAGRTAPHHDQSMRNAEQGTRNELALGPRAPEQRAKTDDRRSETMYNDEDETAGNANGSHNGGSSADGEDHADDDDSFDDDMMDKISSSPSIDDGGCLSSIVQLPQRS